MVGGEVPVIDAAEASTEAGVDNTEHLSSPDIANAITDYLEANETVDEPPVAVAEEDKPEAQPMKEEKETPQETLRRLIDYFGDQLFHYHSYTGTIAQMMEVCPAAPVMLNRGFDGVVAWISKYAIEQPEENKPEDKKEDENKTDEPPVPVNRTAESSVAVRVEKKTPPPAQPKAIKESTTPIERVISDEPGVDKRPLPTDQVSKAEPLIRSSSLDAESPAEPQSKNALHHVREEVLEEAQLTTEEKTDIEEPGLVDEAAYIDMLNMPLTKTPKAEPESELDSQPHRKSILPHLPEPNGEDEKDFPTQAVTQHAVKPEDTLLTETEDIPWELDEVTTEDQPPSVVVQPTLHEFDDSTQAVVFFEDWAEKAQQEPPLEILLTHIVDQLDKHEALVVDQADSVEMALLAAGNTDKLDEPGTPVREPIMVLIDIPRIPKEVLTPFDIRFAEQHQPELYAMLLTVEGAKRSVDRLYIAKTQEECATNVEVLVADLIVVLRSLGYENPEKIIRDFLSSYSPESLRDLIYELERSLRGALHREAHYKKTRHAHTRHIRLEKFVSFVKSIIRSLGHAPELAPTTQ